MSYPCYGLVLCPFGQSAGMHAEAAWNAVSVVNLSVGLVPRPRMAWDETCLMRVAFAIHIAHLIRSKVRSLPSVRTLVRTSKASTIRATTAAQYPLFRSLHILHTSSPQTLYVTVMHAPSVGVLP